MPETKTQELINIDKLSLVLFGYYGGIILDKRIWGIFGFTQRPKRGSFFDFMVSKKQLILEDFVRKQIFAIAFVDLKNALKQIDAYNSQEIDYRALTLVGIICQARKVRVLGTVDDMIQSILEMDGLAKPIKGFGTRLLEKLEESVSFNAAEKAMMILQLNMSFQAVVDGEGILINLPKLISKLEGLQPEGSINAGGLSRDQIDKLIQVMYGLVNE